MRIHWTRCLASLDCHLGKICVIMKWGFRKPSTNKRIAARTSWKRVLRHSLGLKAPRGWGWLTNPRRAAYNRVYNRTTRGCLLLLGILMAACASLAILLFGFFRL